MAKLKSKSLLVIFLFTLFTSYFISNRINEIANGQNTCVCSYDGFGYYMYLPHFFQKGNLDIKKEWAQDLQNKYCNGTEAYQLLPQSTGKHIDLYHMGMAFVEAPGFLAGDLSAKILGYKQDGFSKPYYIAFVLNMFLIMIGGLIYFRKLLLLFFTDNITALTMAVILVCTNYFITFYHSVTLPHIVLFSLNSAFLYFVIKYTRTNGKSALVISAIILGLTVAIRPTQALWGIIPAILLWKEKGTLFSYIKTLSIYPLFGLLWNLPQLFYWKIYGGSWFIPNLHTEDLTFFDPYTLKFLFSYKKGWLLYTPVFILAFIGFITIYRENRKLFAALFIFSIVNLYVLSSWECWWYASSFSQRVMIDSYPVYAISFGFLFAYISRKILLKWITGIYVFLTAFLNVFQSYQAHIGILAHDRMTKEHYWFIFGKTFIPNYTDKYLELDRANTEWTNDPRYQDKSEFTIIRKPFFSFKGNYKPIPLDHIDIGKVVILDKVPTDETLLEVSVDVLTKDSTKSSLIRFETFSKYNFYSWNSLEVSQGLPQNKVNHLTYRFNVQNIRHRKDELVVYIFDENSCPVEVKSMKIEAYSLIRK